MKQSIGFWLIVHLRSCLASLSKWFPQERYLCYKRGLEMSDNYDVLVAHRVQAVRDWVLSALSAPHSRLSVLEQVRPSAMRGRGPTPASRSHSAPLLLPSAVSIDWRDVWWHWQPRVPPGDGQVWGGQDQEVVRARQVWGQVWGHQEVVRRAHAGGGHGELLCAPCQHHPPGPHLEPRQENWQEGQNLLRLLRQQVRQAVVFIESL